MVDLKAFMGDASDTLPGVKGVGKVTATRLLQEHGSLEAVFGAVGRCGGGVWLGVGVCVCVWGGGGRSRPE